MISLKWWAKPIHSQSIEDNLFMDLLITRSQPLGNNLLHGEAEKLIFLDIIIIHMDHDCYLSRISKSDSVEIACKTFFNSLFYTSKLITNCKKSS